jgi:hypothetical protein
MTDTVSSTFQTQNILDFSSARLTKQWDLQNTEIFPYKDVASGLLLSRVPDP